MTRLICSVIHGCYLDDSNGAAVANRVSVTAGEGTTLSARAGQTEIGGFR